MTAQELFALYSPLWQAVPETRPKGLDFGSEDVGDNVALMWFLDGSPFAIDNPEIPAALCRISCEDWLRQKYRLRLNETAMGQTDFAEWVVLREPSCPSEVSDIIRAGPTIHHALVSAALAVTGVKP